MVRLAGVTKDGQRTKGKETCFYYRMLNPKQQQSDSENAALNELHLIERFFVLIYACYILILLSISFCCSAVVCSERMYDGSYYN